MRTIKLSAALTISILFSPALIAGQSSPEVINEQYINDVLVQDPVNKKHRIGNGRFSILPAVKSKDELQTVANLIKEYSYIALKSAKTKDWDTYFVAAEKSASLLSYMTYIEASSLKMVEMQSADKTFLFPGQYAIVANGKLSTQPMNVSVFTGDRLDVADNTPLNFEDNPVKWFMKKLFPREERPVPERPAPPLSKQDKLEEKPIIHEPVVIKKQLDHLPESGQYQFTDSQGVPFTVERSGNEYAFHNLGKHTVEVNTKAFNVLPLKVSPKLNNRPYPHISDAVYVMTPVMGYMRSDIKCRDEEVHESYIKDSVDWKTAEVDISMMFRTMVIKEECGLYVDEKKAIEAIVKDINTFKKSQKYQDMRLSYAGLLKSLETESMNYSEKEAAVAILKKGLNAKASGLLDLSYDFKNESNIEGLLTSVSGWKKANV